MPTAEINGITMYYEEQGQGEPLLLIMGLGMHSLAWIMQTAAMAQKFRTIVFDNRGAGRTSAPPGPYTIRQMADDTRGLLDHLGIEKAHIVGVSMGGMIAQELAINYPERVGRLVLMSSLAKQPDGQVADWWLGFGEWAREQGADPRQFLTYTLPWLFTANLLGNTAMVSAAVNQSAMDPYPISTEGFKGQAAAARAHDTVERLAQIKSPTLVLVGKEDVLTPVAYSQVLAERIPGARLQILEHGGHGMTLEYAADVNNALLAFLTAPVEATA
jgi:3-oxoadipate enol-lactonase